MSAETTEARLERHRLAFAALAGQVHDRDLRAGLVRRSEALCAPAARAAGA